MLHAAPFFLVTYLLGSLPFGLWLSKAAGLGDIRSIGSGNIGATNVLRTGNKPIALLTLLLDAGKGAAAVWLAEQYFLPWQDGMVALAGLFAVLGHVFSVFLKFKGGKGVATGMGVMLMLDWRIGLFMLAMWALVFAASRISALSALLAFAWMPVVAFYMPLCPLPYAWYGWLLAGLIVFTHRSNIVRLWRGTEHRFTQRV